jgi:hypothetical protein
MRDYPSDEVEAAFRHLWRVGPVGEDWAAQAELFTPDATYIDHYYGQKTPDEFRTWCTQLMTDEFPELYTVYEWHVVDGARVVVHMQNRRDHPDPAGTPIDFAGISVFEYGGDGRWSYEMDYWAMADAVAAGRAYRDAVARIDPAHPRRRTRRHWPAAPEWAHP